ncbi:3-ketoacyl-reductase [Phascolomyces articulosus]|uniref:3-ketoacyl-reductase n=1 Tax=Phascolomyces articulosus TaxID=60185 RepID=A0AAD5P8E8_9FUNG|nr:3-ketoacyl-reductase [Phascolomyces articulosus]
MSLLQKTALITGATRGIGFAIANTLANHGVNTLLIGRDSQRVQDAERIFREKYQDTQHQGVVLDKLIKEKKIDILVNAAGISRDGLLLRMKDDDLNETMTVNLFGTMRVSQIISKSMIQKRQGGCIINISSVVGVYGNAGQTVYSASKAGIIGFTKSLAKELGPSQIRVNAIAPGFIETDMTADLLKSQETKDKLIESIPLQRLGHVDDVAEAALFLAQSQYMNGAVLNIDGGLTL